MPGSHTHFIEALEELCDLLERKCSKQDHLSEAKATGKEEGVAEHRKRTAPSEALGPLPWCRGTAVARRHQVRHTPRRASTANQLLQPAQALHRALRLVQAKQDHKFKQYLTGEYMSDDTMIANLVILVLTVAQDSGKAGRMLSMVQGAGEPRMGCRIVTSCEEVMEKFLRANGDKAVKEPKPFCKSKSFSDVKGLQVRADQDAFWFSLEEVIDPTSLADLQAGMVRL